MREKNESLPLRNRLREVRTAQGLSQSQLADMVGVSRNTISSIETGQFSPTAKLALLLCKLFNLEPRHGQKSEFAGNYFECMKSPFLGKNGHIAMRTPDLKAAMEELEENGFRFRMETAAYFEDGRIKNVYLEGEYGGFAIHIMQK